MTTQFKLIAAGLAALVVIALLTTIVILKKDIKALNLKAEADAKEISMLTAAVAQEKEALGACSNNYNNALTAMIQEGENKKAAKQIYNPDCSKCPAIPSGKEITADELQAFKEFKNIDWNKVIELNNDLVDQFNAVMLERPPAAAPAH